MESIIVNILNSITGNLVTDLVHILQDEIEKSYPVEKIQEKLGVEDYDVKLTLTIRNSLKRSLRDFNKNDKNIIKKFLDKNNKKALLKQTLISTNSKKDYSLKYFIFSQEIEPERKTICQFLDLYFNNVVQEKEHRFTFETQSIISHIKSESFSTKNELRENFENVEANLKKHLSELIDNKSTDEFSIFYNSILRDHLGGNFNHSQLLKNKKKELFEQLGYIYFFIGNELLTKEDFIQSKENYLNALRYIPNLKSAQINASILLRMEGKIEESINLLNSVLESDNQDFFIYYNLGICYQLLGDYDSAMECYTIGLRLNPDDIDTKTQQALAIANYKDFRLGISILKEIALTHNELLINYNIGVLLYKNNFHSEAVLYFHKCINIAPNDFSSLKNLGYCYGIIGNQDDCIKFTSKALSINAKDTMSWINLGNAYLYKKDFQEARKKYIEASKLEPLLPIVWTSIGEAERHMENFLEAYGAYQTGLKLDNENCIAWFGIGVSALELGKKYESDKAFNMVKKLNPELGDKLNL